MTHYIGIDLGTTNSAIASFDGKEVQVWKSPEQNEVTPSVIYFDRRGNKMVGMRAYNQLARSSKSVARLFKRYIGTATKVKVPSAGLELTPQECSAEVLKTLMGYLPEEIRSDADIGAVITVPAAFNQMQKDATMAAAEAAQIGRVALMQEPVAAVMSALRSKGRNGTFLVFDLGGGTLDVTIADSHDGRVSLLSTGGVAMCGGRDFDRAIVDHIVRPWLDKQFDLPDDFVKNSKYEGFRSQSDFATERAKIELSSRTESLISTMDADTGIEDESGEELYLDIPLERDEYTQIIEPFVLEGVRSARETMDKAGLSSDDISEIVFVGGPTHYKPLRDKVLFELGIRGSDISNPMTAVAIGAAVFAESVDWNDKSRGRKSNKGNVTASARVQLSFDYQSRSPSDKAKVVVKLGTPASAGTEIQFDSLISGWSSGRQALRDGTYFTLPLDHLGEHIFVCSVFDTLGSSVALDNKEVLITRTAATVDAIPAAKALGFEVLERLGGQPTLDIFVNEGDSLPKKGSRIYKAGEALPAGSSGALRFKVWEGDILRPVADNRFVGDMKITGQDFDADVIQPGDELHVDYEMLDSGNLVFTVTVPAVGGSFNSGRNFYSPQGAEVDLENHLDRVLDDAAEVSERIAGVQQKINDQRLSQANERLRWVADRGRSPDATLDDTKKASDNVLEAKRLLAQVRKDNAPAMRQFDLDNEKLRWEKHKDLANPSETEDINNLIRSAQNAMMANPDDADALIDELHIAVGSLVWRQPWFKVDVFNFFAKSPYLFFDSDGHKNLIAEGRLAIQNDDMDGLNGVLVRLFQIKIDSSTGEEMLERTNILR